MWQLVGYETQILCGSASAGLQVSCRLNPSSSRNQDTIRSQVLREPSAFGDRNKSEGSLSNRSIAVRWIVSSSQPPNTAISVGSTIFEEKIALHMSKCPATKLLESVKQWPYYCPALNAGSDGDDDDEHDRFPTKRARFESMPKDAFEELVRRIELSYAKYSNAAVEDCLSEPAACSRWLCSEVDRRHPLQQKHIVQQASMLGNLERFGLLRARTGEQEEMEKKRKEAFIEFGAGRGYLSHMLSDCYAADNVLLVERRSYKFKADRTLRYSAGVSLTRLRLDIEDLNLDAVDALQGCHFVAVGKHICGAATDLALRCCLATAPKGREAEDSAPVLAGIGFATCCHHLCEWKAYVNKEFFWSLGFSRSDFEIITWLTSWALSGSESDERRAALGLKCKQLVDMGRVCWLEQRGMRAKMVKYVGTGISPENKLIMAAKKIYK